ncbi:glutathione S-transferase family protein [Leptospira ognonensis]|uniref:glutathione transferase n=1 Tax=Leptospira ognonensis TaxID=2484945 RepID=A0A4R9JWA7_9LEPT|nr:glutathione S-transferase family protein [Leptospira ognonensis]TGL57290.1 glutathione S-transferase family protein [Leptospira ognonensis]
MNKPKLISFKLCPYVQRSVITLKEKNVSFDIAYIDLANKPDWFLKISPLGRVPVLQIGNEVLFESAVINEYLNETNPPSLHPSDPLKKAKHRSWMEFASTLLSDQYVLTLAKEEVEYSKKYNDIKNKFALLENELPEANGAELYFSGNTFCLVDTSYAPFFMRLEFLIHARNEFSMLYENMPKVALWAKTLLSRPSVINSVLPEVEAGYIQYIKDHKSYLAGIL